MLRKTLAVLLIVALIGGAIGFYMWNKPHRSADGEKPAAVLTSEELFIQYSTDPAASDVKYLEKVLQVSGTVSTKSVNEMNETKIALATSDMLAEIAFIMKPGENVEDIQVGTNIALKGICTGYNTDVEFKQAVVAR